MYPSIQESAILLEAENLMKDLMAKYDPSHDAFHVQRVRRTSLALANALSPKPDLFVVELAALLHDILDKKYVSAEKAADPYGFFLPFFTAMAAKPDGLDLVQDGRARQIAQIIDNISWTTESKLRKNNLWSEWHENCLELHCVQDADRLDAIGAFGIMRCAAYSAAVNRPLYVPPNEPKVKASAIQIFHDRLLPVRDRLKTAPGRALGEKRHSVLVSFIASVEEEYNNSILAAEDPEL
ncbi:Metal dependent phosphohydrolase [Mycena venus]|uniref:Metal dependent phosphohydrolase n=1 Tax=Mycena venus TaxID=2733690 RepID=A0A8H6X9Y4_9AGAR|nr:Metal dependent phosphohydrolase [Mycena venus]